jgi:predicted hotdog family 3-hydroxylacyl-ACP dehydratase
MIMGRTAIQALIPQKDAMCLLDSVEYWDGRRIICTSMQHRSAVNPLRTRAGLSSLHGIEFAAQAMAAHGGLTAAGQEPPRVGLLLSVRDCVFHCRRLDDIAEPLTIEAEQMGNNGEARLYRYKVSARDVLLVEGRAAVMLRGGAQA